MNGIGSERSGSIRYTPRGIVRARPLTDMWLTARWPRVWISHLQVHAGIATLGKPVMPSPMPLKKHPLSLKAKLTLASFGIVSALLISIIALQVIPTSPHGTEFNSLEDLRRAMLEPGQTSDPNAAVDSSQVSLRSIVLPHPSDSIIYSLKPNLDLRFARARVVTNSCGMRSPERPIRKPSQTYRIALLGDSFAFGWGVEQTETFAQKLENNLNEKSHGALRFEVLNFGVPGYSTFQEVALFEERALDFDPDAVLVYFVQNDFGMPFFIRDMNGSGGMLSSMKFLELGKRLLAPKALDEQVRNTGVDPNRALARLAAITSARSIPLFLTINPRKSWKSDLQRLPSLKTAAGAQFIPLREGLLEYIKRENISEEALTLSFDPHPSPLRHKILGALLTPYFLNSAGL